MSTWAVNFHQNLEPLSLKIFKTLCNQKHLNIIRNRVIISSSDWPDLSLVSPSCLVKNNPCYKLVIYFLTWPLNLFMSRTRSVSASFMVSWNKHTLDKLHYEWWFGIWLVVCGSNPVLNVAACWLSLKASHSGMKHCNPFSFARF